MILSGGHQGPAQRARGAQGDLGQARWPAQRDQAGGVARRVGERRVARDHRQRQDVEFGRAPGEQQRQGIVDAGIGIENCRDQTITSASSGAAGACL